VHVGVVYASIFSSPIVIKSNPKMDWPRSLHQFSCAQDHVVLIISLPLDELSGRMSSRLPKRPTLCGARLRDTRCWIRGGCRGLSGAGRSFASCWTGGSGSFTAVLDRALHDSPQVLAVPSLTVVTVGDVATLYENFYSVSFDIDRRQARIFFVPADGHVGANVAVVLSASTTYGARRLLSGSDRGAARLRHCGYRQSTNQCPRALDRSYDLRASFRTHSPGLPAGA
jgi:hypothetical protein